ncbi:MAG: FAD-dependent oxidoreductase, partial [Cyclobacteriaceae bacterium]|nr:FAD-dependent oxidoreductase [Cyclobacteriaceae bacterium]
MRLLNLFLLSFTLIIYTNCQNESNQTKYDLVVYGGTSGGIAAAIQAKRMGKSVILIEPGSRMGGLTTGGLGQTDIGNKAAVGGISREFYERIKTYYDNPDNWKWQEMEEYFDGGQTRTKIGESAMWTFEPSAALKVYEDFIKSEKIELVLNKKLDRSNGVVKIDGKIISIKMLSGEEYHGKMFIDAT